MIVPGIVYSILLAIGAAVVEYLTTGPGVGLPIGPIIIAAVPIILKLFTVYVAPEPPVPQSSAGGPAPERKGKGMRLLLG